MMDFERTCRTCMKSQNDVALINLFGPLKIEDNWSLKLADLLKEIITLEVIEAVLLFVNRSYLKLKY